MKFRYEIPQSFWGLFRSVNREIYMEALLAINAEYEYSNYFLSREVCLQVLSEMCSQKSFCYEEEWEAGSPEDAGLSLPRKLLNWLLRTGWLKRTEDYETMSVNIVIPDYAACFIETFDHLVNEPLEDTQVYIQNIYATLFSFRQDRRGSVGLLRTALINTRKLNKLLQDMLHNMDRFFDRLLKQQTFGELLMEHLDGYVEEMVTKKYHILKTSDNFYIYKMDIKRCIRQMREDEEWIEDVRKREQSLPDPSASFRYRREEDVLDLLDQLERGFEDVERRIANIDREHSKYVRATVSRLNYLLQEESDRKGLVVQLLNCLGEVSGQEQEERICKVGEAVQLFDYQVLHDSPLYKRRRYRRFEELVTQEQAQTELSRSEVLSLNQLQHRFSKAQIEGFLLEHMEDGVCDTSRLVIENDEDFEKLILAYDMSTRKNSRFEAVTGEGQIRQGGYSYPAVLFVERTEDGDFLGESTVTEERGQERV